MYTYDTVSSATDGLRKRGYTMDLNLEDNCLVCQGTRFNVDDFEIVEVHRFEGNSDPADESVVYAVEGKNGEKGVLVNAFGPYADSLSAEMAKKLQLHKD